MHLFSNAGKSSLAARLCDRLPEFEHLVWVGRGANLTDSVFTKSLGNILSVSFNLDGKLLATGSDDGVVCLFEAINGTKVLTH